MSGDRAFQRLRKGNTGNGKHVTVRWRPTRQGEVRVGIVVSRKVGKAVVRNRVRRRLREAVRELTRQPLRDAVYESSLPSFDLLVIARPSAASATYAELKRSLSTAFERAKLL
ncbi:MAG TPA: ribonuclease P protein component [Trueperaceae bacterium]|nr:ribonuclease P protein component [Trueperaceae bacterium]HRQ10106.1 ribonuclease P protein component [Trueperaceae bacterium]